MRKKESVTASLVEADNALLQATLQKRERVSASIGEACVARERACHSVPC
jgi:hypothetical protein